ncbi:ABC transporter permease subunit [Streptomyces sp. NPDC006460]|uniref:ABC transporter permease n=1 Tax=Streptomyces sp. NPDC006460 TaxID=3154304 RepID=UPI0033A9AAE7
MAQVASMLKKMEHQRRSDSAKDLPSSKPPTGGDNTRRRRFRRDRLLLICAIPGIAILLLFQYVPLLGNVIAFQDYQPFIGIQNSEWVGLRNFEVIFNGDPQFINALNNTLIILLLQIFLVFPAPIALALILNTLTSERIKHLVQSILYLPHFLSWVIIVSVFQQFLGDAGLLNTVLRSHDLGSVDVIGNVDLFKALLTSQVMWKDTGWATILFLAALSQISPSLYEAASVDGAGKWRQMWHVTLPGLKSIIILLLILRLGDAVSVGFEQIILQQGPVGREASEVLDTYVYNNGIVGGDWGVSAAVGLVKGLVGVALVLGANKVAHMFGERGIYKS